MIEEVELYKKKGRKLKAFGRKARKRLLAKPRRKIKVGSTSKLLKAADAIFSRFVRLSRADENGTVACYTCGYKNHYKKMQNGHYISRYYKKYRFSEKQCRVQCRMCNMWKSGDLATFRQNLLKEIGEPALLSMESDYKELFPLTPEYLNEIISHYTPLVDKLLKNSTNELNS